MKKYVFTGETKIYDGVVVRRIKYVGRPTDEIQKNQLGGWIESEKNLSQKQKCWVGDEAIVYGNAVVRENAWVFENAVVRGDSYIGGNADVCGNAVVENETIIFGIRVQKVIRLKGYIPKVYSLPIRFKKTIYSQYR